MEKYFRHMRLLARSEIKRLVAENDLDKASELLWELAEILGGERTNEVVILKRNISEHDREYRVGNLSFKESSEIKNRIADRLLAILENLAKPSQEPSCV